MFGEVRSLLHGESDTWAEVRALIQAWPEDDLTTLREVVFPYCFEHYARHPETREVEVLEAFQAFGDEAARVRGEVLLELGTDIMFRVDHERFIEARLSPGPKSWRSLRIETIARGTWTPDPLLYEWAEWCAALELPELETFQAPGLVLTLAGKGATWMERVRDVQVTLPELTGLLLHLFDVDAPRPELRTLHMSGVRHFEEAVLELIFAHPGTAGLDAIDVSDCYLSPECFDHLIDAPHLREVHTLDVRYNWHISREAFEHLCDQPWNQADTEQYYQRVWE